MMKQKVSTARVGLPQGWSENRVQRAIKFYENQSDEEAAKEDEKAFSGRRGTFVEIPKPLLPTVLQLIETHRNKSKKLAVTDRSAANRKPVSTASKTA